LTAWARDLQRQLHCCGCASGIDHEICSKAVTKALNQLLNVGLVTID
jgi:hypothetical protein